METLKQKQLQLAYHTGLSFDIWMSGREWFDLLGTKVKVRWCVLMDVFTSICLKVNDVLYMKGAHYYRNERHKSMQCDWHGNPTPYSFQFHERRNNPLSQLRAIGVVPREHPEHKRLIQWVVT